MKNIASNLTECCRIFPVENFPLPSLFWILIYLQVIKVTGDSLFEVYLLRLQILRFIAAVILQDHCFKPTFILLAGMQIGCWVLLPGCLWPATHTVKLAEELSAVPLESAKASSKSQTVCNRACEGSVEGWETLMGTPGDRSFLCPGSDFL